MKLIVGLGNPGQKYTRTRHNVGFQVIDRLAKDYNLNPKQRCEALVAATFIDNEEIVFAQPLTYMNKSGRAVKCLVKKFNLDLEDILIVYDDLNLEPGKIRLKTSGSSGGHNGMKSIINHLSTNEFPRLRIGIGRPEPGFEVAHYVLGKFTPAQREVIEEALDEAVEAVKSFISRGPVETMNKFN